MILHLIEVKCYIKQINNDMKFNANYFSLQCILQFQNIFEKTIAHLLKSFYQRQHSYCMFRGRQKESVCYFHICASHNLSLFLLLLFLVYERGDCCVSQNEAYLFSFVGKYR